MISCPRYVLVDATGLGVVLAPTHVWPLPFRARVVDWPDVALLVRLDRAGDDLTPPSYRASEAAVARSMYIAEGGDEPVWSMTQQDRYDLEQLQIARSSLRRR